MRSVAIAALMACLSGCQAGYYLHLAKGHTDLMRERVPVARVLADPQTPAALRERLQRADDMLVFAETALALPVDDAYRTYVALERGFVVWNLFAAPAYSLTPKTWCFPVAGCTSYRGFFDLERAAREAEALRQQGYDVYEGGAVAYSTLGWFADPLTTPMLAGDDAQIADLLFHELAHRRFYLKGDTRFNESLATSVGREGARRWLARHGDPALVVDMRQSERLRQQMLSLVAEAREALAILYDSESDEAVLAAGKAAVQAQLRRSFELAKEDEPALARYARWFAGPLNNAQLNTFSDYNQWVSGFDAVLLRCGGGWGCFWQEVERIAALPAQQRTRVMQQLSHQ
ncbi:aminopeptidase [Alcanivorax sp. JB21]|uniref:aminopeptidase n=1 Tax=Alcanivorax limicola TaxID=2874102 RepID=UPI001CBCEC61|nr:aminopeptidase [Alcanivorax limicola]MBZ2189758.1 aminopeptidase [Alcanivorax limicola]